MKTTKKLISLLAIAAMTVACSSEETPQETPPPPPPPTEEEPTEKYPADSNPTKFDGFFKRTMLIDHTGTGCGACPYMVVSLNKIEEGADVDKVVVVASHTYNRDDPMYNPFGSKYKACLTGGFYPSLSLDMRITKDAFFSGSGATATQIVTKCNTLETKYPAKVAIAAAVTFDGTNFIVNTGVKVGVTGTYNIGIIVLEDNIKATQSNFGAKGYNFNIHKHAIRGGMPSSITGEPLKEGTITAGELIKKDFTVPLPEDTKAENAKIVVYVACPDTEGGTKYYINNTIVCKPGSSVAFKYKE